MEEKIRCLPVSLPFFLCVDYSLAIVSHPLSWKKWDGNIMYSLLYGLSTSSPGKEGRFSSVSPAGFVNW